MRIRVLHVLLCLPVLFSNATAADTHAGRIGIVVECRSIKSLLEDIGIVSQSLKIPFEKGTMEATLSGMFASSGMAGIDRNKPFRICVISRNQDSSPAGNRPASSNKATTFILPLTDNGDIYMKSATAAYAKAEMTNGFHHFASPVIKGAGYDDELFAAVSGGNVVIGSTIETVEIALSLFNTPDPWKATLTAVNGTIKAAVDIHAVIQTVESSIKKLGDMTRLLPAASQPGTSANPARILAAEGDLILSALKQISTYVIGIGVKDGVIELNTLLSPLSGRNLSTSLDAVTPPPSKYFSAMPAGTFINITGSGLNVFDIFVDQYSDMMGKIMEATCPDGNKTAAEIKKTILSFKGTLSGDHSIGVVSGPGTRDLALIEVLGLKNPASFRKIIMDTLTSTSTIYSNLAAGTSLRLDKPRLAGDIEVVPFTVSYKAPTNLTAQSAIPEGLFSNYRAELAISGNDLIYVIGGNPVTMDQAILRLKTGGADIHESGAFAALFPQPPSRLTGIHSLEVVKLVKWFIAGVPNGETIGQMIPDSGSGIAGYTTMKGGKLLSVTRMGMAELSAIKNAIPALAVLILPAMTPGAAATKATSNDTDRARCLGNLRMIDAAKEQCMLERGLKDGDIFNPAWLSKYLLRAKMPECPAGGTYTINPAGKAPTCSVPGHIRR